MRALPGCALSALLLLFPFPARRAAADPAREIVVGLARPADLNARATPLAAHFSALNLIARLTLAQELPALPADVREPNPFAFDPASVWLLEAPDSAAAAGALRALADDPAVAWAEPNQPRFPAIAAYEAGFPDDPLFRDSRQWGLRNLGPDGVYGGVPGADVHAADAWRWTTGARDVVLAIADTGIDPDHPELQCALAGGGMRITLGLNVTADPSPSFADSFGHGTPVAGVMAARTGEGPHFDSLGVAGMCGGDGGANPGCRIVPIKIAPGHSGLATSFDIARAILYAVACGARALNLSFAGGAPSALERAALVQAITHGCVVVCAAGNRGVADGTAPQYPAAYAADGLCIQVGASDCFDRRAAFSSHGPGLDVVAPGVDVWTTFMTYPSAAGARWPGYVAASGTSFAAPFATGTVGLLAAARPELQDRDFQELIRAGADDVGDPGVDGETGWGRLDAARALEQVAPAYAIWHDEVAATTLRVIADDTLDVGEGGPGSLNLWRGRHAAELVEASVSVAIPDSFADLPRVWPRIGGTFTLRGSFAIPSFVPWCEVAERVPRSFTLRGYLYRMRDTSALEPWVPLPPDQARFGFTVIGSRALAAGVAPPRAAMLRAGPNPFTAAVRIAGPARATLAIADVSGRIVRAAALDAAGGFTWDGLDQRGRPVPPGIYLARAGVNGPVARLVRLRAP